MGKGKKILIVDDNLEIRKTISMRLEIENYTIITASDGEEAVSKTRDENPELIILDLMMPKMDGFEFCRMIKFDDKYKDIPIIALSALDKEEDRQRAIKNGADFCFIKPFNLDLLLVKIKDLIGQP
jgi:DNA-binding response OmpR family regulator